MINGLLDQFLDTGWYTEATLFYNGFIYWCEAQSDLTTNTTTFFIDKWAAEIPIIILCWNLMGL